MNRCYAALIPLVLILSPALSAQDVKKLPQQEIYLYQGADRSERLLAKAQQEGTVSLYTSLSLNDSIPITEAFEKQFGVKVALWRAGSEKVLQRAVTEASAGRFAVDVIETNGPEMEALYREQLLSEFYSPAFRDIPAAAFPPHRHYVADRFNFFVIGYNTNLVKPGEVPSNYQDLLHPRWAGKIAVDAGDRDWFAAMVKHMGENEGLEYFRRLAASRPQVRSGHSLTAELLATGEIAIDATTYNKNIDRLALKGAPVKWKALEPTFGRPNAIGVAKNAPHPYAALLFAEFILSRQGQELLKQRNMVPASTAVDSPNTFKYKMIDPVIVLDEAEKWEKLWTDLFLKGRSAQKKVE